jgi:predicted HTH domain antitoxin
MKKTPAGRIDPRNSNREGRQKHETKRREAVRHLAADGLSTLRRDSYRYNGAYESAENHLMPLTIPDQLLNEAGLSEPEARVEIACRLYDAGKLTMPQATRWAEISRTQLEAALLERHLPLVRVNEQYWQQEVEGLERLRS